MTFGSFDAGSTARLLALEIGASAIAAVWHIITMLRINPIGRPGGILMLLAGLLTIAREIWRARAAVIPPTTRA